MLKWCWFSFFILSILTPYAQQIETSAQDTLSHKKFLTAVNFNKDQSYVSFGSGFGNQRALIFEGKLSPSYFISSRERKWALMLNPQIQVRMLNQPSVPIQVPSYRLYLTYYHSLDFLQKTFLSGVLQNDALWFISLSHHSNGQNGKFYLNDTTKTINLTSGSFSVNFLQLGISSYTLHYSGANYFSLREIKILAEVYPASWCDPHLQRNYGFYRIFSSFGFSGPWRKEKSDWLNRWLENSRIELKTGWILGEYHISDRLPSRRLIVDCTYKYYPPWFDEIAFFVRFYRGQDYYNIYYEKQLVNLTLGITTNTVKLSSAIRYLGGKKKNLPGN